MRVMDHNWSVSQETAECSRDKPPFSFVIGQYSTVWDRHRLGLAIRTQISVCKSQFPSTGTAVTLFCAKTVQYRSLLPRKLIIKLNNYG